MPWMIRRYPEPADAASYLGASIRCVGVPLETLLLILVFLVGSVLLAVYGAIHVRKRVPLEIQIEQNDVAGFFLAVLGVVYGVLLAFAVIAVWEDLDDARDTTDREANAIGDLYRLAEGLPDDTRRVIQGQVMAYASLVIQEEWREMQHGRESQNALKQMDALWASVLGYQPSGAREEAIYDKLLEKVGGINDERRQRLVASREGIPPLVWAVLIGGGVVTVLFTYFFGLKHLRALLGMTALYVASIGFVLFLIAALDFPFSGTVHVSPEALELVLDRLGELERARR
jgi:hypothetical protein